VTQDSIPPERISELLLAAAGRDPGDPALALASERAAAELSPQERAVVARALERTAEIMERRADELEHTDASELRTRSGDHDQA
jgi:hypothetical protein